MVNANMEEERRLAIEDGDINEDGVPFIAVIGDGGWGVRSYNHSMRSNVGWVCIFLFISCPYIIFLEHK
jgi:hypothetical protein